MNVEFSIEASGDSLQFQWQKDCSDLNSDDDKYWGVNTDTLHIVATEGSDEGDYRCLVENDVGKLFSDKALLSFGKLIATATCICSGKLYNQIQQLFVGSNYLPFAEMPSFFYHSHELSLRACTNYEYTYFHKD